MKNNGGDDWNDKPYEHNAGEPYDIWYDKDNKTHDIDIISCYFEFPTIAYPACEYYYYTNNSWSNQNSPYSVEDINNKEYPWLVLPYLNVSILAETTYEEFKKLIKEYKGRIYEESIL